jgi:hypothetical protein
MYRRGFFSVYLLFHSAHALRHGLLFRNVQRLYLANLKSGGVSYYKQNKTKSYARKY